ncbi:hypothetical protein CIP107546_00423 [Corynebacterium diphtheriae]|nr:hypothetical protein CIP107546_00423 [Corynebacterium diphtheriae]
MIAGGSVPSSASAVTTNRNLCWWVSKLPTASIDRWGNEVARLFPSQLGIFSRSPIRVFLSADNRRFSTVPSAGCPSKRGSMCPSLILGEGKIFAAATADARSARVIVTCPVEAPHVPTFARGTLGNERKLLWSLVLLEYFDVVSVEEPGAALFFAWYASSGCESSHVASGTTQDFSSFRCVDSFM